MKRFLLSFTLISFSAAVCLACFSGNSSHGTDPKLARKYWLKHSKLSHSRTPAELNTVLPSATNHPWGGNQAGWKEEAVLANATSEALNDGWAQAGVKDVLVAVPVLMETGKVPSQNKNNDNWPYGDGQSNAKPRFGNGWTEKQPQLVATLVLFQSGAASLKIRFHHSLALSQNIEIKYSQNGSLVSNILANPTKTAQGDSEWTWIQTDNKKLPVWGDLFQNHVAFVRSVDGKDWFPIDFRDVRVSNSDLLNQLPENKRKIGSRTFLDPENVGVQGQNTNDFPYNHMGPDNFAQELTGTKYFPVDTGVKPLGIHSHYITDQGDSVQTAVGEGSSVVFQSPKDLPTSPFPFKMVYICFDQRREDAENAPGVPSGGGWHEIGDPAETVINSLENASLAFGYANGVPAASTPSGGFAYGLTDVAVVRKLAPGSAIVTAAGTTSYSERFDQKGIKTNPNPNHSWGFGEKSGRNYHWFFFDQTHYVCGMEWVHPCVPSPTNHLGLQCSQ